MHETSKAVARRLHDPAFTRFYFVGDGIDIGSGPDPLGQYFELFPLMRSCRPWDVGDGDAQYLEGVDDNSFDFVHSSHCLEHMYDPTTALNNWIRVLKVGGHLIVLVPDEDLYEQGAFPSTFNADHKWTFTICKPFSWSPKSRNVVRLLTRGDISIRSIKLLDATYQYDLPRTDQTMTPIGESAIEFVVRKI
jgi:SAM-dependent methyltransferase